MGSSHQHQFDVLTNHLPIMVAHCDGDLRFQYVNQAYADRFGVKAENLIGQRAEDVVGPEAIQAILPYLERVLRGERVEYETWVPYRTLGRRYMRCIYTPELDADGQAVGFVAGVLDETARKTAEDGLSASRARFDFVATSADIGVWSCDVPLSDLIWNAACKAHFGLPADATVTIETFYERMHPDDVAPTRAAIERALSQGVAYDVEYRTRQQDGSFRWIRAIGRAEYGEGGVARRFEGITLDVTAKRRGEEQLRELADAMPQIVWSADADGRVDYLNRRWYELTGKTPGDLDVEGIVHPEDRDAARTGFRRSVETGEPYECEYRLCLPEFDEPRWFLGRARAVRDETGRIARWYATSTDIHDQKHTETALLDSRNRLRAALDASRTGTFRWEIDTNALDWDDNLDRLFGLEPGATAQSLPEFLRLVHPEDRERVIDACARCASEGADFVEEFRVIWPDGSVRWLFDQGRVLTESNGRRYMIGACVDITERRMKEDALRAADRQKDEFLGMLAHEIRNPLAPMMYSASILERRLQDPSLKRPLDVIYRQATRMIRIVDDLLDVSRVTQGKISLQRERVSVATLLAQSVDATRPVFESRRQLVALHPVDPAHTVLGDPVRLAQVVENLLINAAKYTPNGGRIDITAGAEGESIAIAVKDTGVGIATDMLHRVFDLFAQADTSLDRAEGGLGIGLTLVDRLTRMHGGEVHAFSAGLGCGSTFTVRLPLMQLASNDEPPAPSIPVTTPRRVLVVDDNVDSADMLETIITMAGHAIRVANDGFTALRVAEEWRPDVVLLDIGLPGKDGYQVITELRALPGMTTATIIATTGYGRDEDRARCLAAGVDDHMTKPVNIEQLHRVVGRAVDSGASRRA